MSEILASQFADKMMKCQSETELNLVRQEIQSYFEAHEDFKKEWREWLVDIRDSQLLTLRRMKDEI